MSSSGVPPRPTKKPRHAAADALVRRKRSTIACQFCRLRKTKCDNVKPICGVCRHHQATCTYAEDDYGTSFEPLDHTDIAPHLEEIKSILRGDVIPRLTALSKQELVAGNLGETQRSTSHVFGSTDTAATDQPRQDSGLGSSSKQLLCLNTRCETVLQWPIVQDSLPMRFHSIDYLLFDRPIADHDTLLLGSPFDNVNSHLHLPLIQSHISASAVGIQEEQFLPLCQKFLIYVHARNPILDPAQLLQYATQVAENGLSWDAPSCLVLIACALACYTEPWPPLQAAPLVGSITQVGDVSPIARVQGDAYYTAASKRLSLLGASIIDIQCFFFASVFEKILMQPIRAWFQIQQASQRLQVLLRKKDHLQLLHHGTGADSQHSAQHLEQRLFWSCWKSEQELMTEVGLPSSGIDKLNYSHFLPDPPALFATSPQMSSSSVTGTDSLSRSIFRSSAVYLEGVDQEQSWSYYLTEISMRRTMVESLRFLYEGPPRDWLTNPDKILRHIDGILQQIDLWYQHLPPIIRFSEDRNASPHAEDELTSYTRSRFMEWREACLRPALYLVLHQYRHQYPELENASPNRHRTDPENVATYHRLHCHAQYCLDLCAAIIRLSTGHLRHGGTWFTMRSTFRSAMQLVASARYNSILASRNLETSPSPNGIPQPQQPSWPFPRKFELPADQTELYTVSLGIFGKWSSEAADVKVMMNMLETSIMNLQPKERA